MIAGPAPRVRQIVFAVTSGIVFSTAYAVHSQATGPGTTTVDFATFHSYWPYSPRFLVPWIAYHLFGDIVNWLSFRIAMAFACFLPAMMLLPRFIGRVHAGVATAPFVPAAFLLIMLAHYCLPNIYAPYYIYDMPSIPFYLIAFLLLTTDDRRSILLGCVFVVVFTLNRETIAVALFHGFAWWFARHREHEGSRRSRAPLLAVISEVMKRRSPEDTHRFAMACIAITLLATILMRPLLMYWLHGGLQPDMKGNFYEGSEIRLVHNFHLMLTNWGFFQQLIATGFGAVIYLPLVWRSQPAPIRWLVIASVPPLLGLLLFSNFFIEPRIYNEFIPLWACLLATAIGWASTAHAIGDVEDAGYREGALHKAQRRHAAE